MDDLGLGSRRDDLRGLVEVARPVAPSCWQLKALAEIGQGGLGPRWVVLRGPRLHQVGRAVGSDEFVDTLASVEGEHGLAVYLVGGVPLSDLGHWSNVHRCHAVHLDVGRHDPRTKAIAPNWRSARRSQHLAMLSAVFGRRVDRLEKPEVSWHQPGA